MIDFNSLPELPHKWKPDFIFEQGNFFVLLVKRDETVSLFYWDGFSVQYTKVETQIRYL